MSQSVSSRIRGDWRFWVGVVTPAVVLLYGALHWSIVATGAGAVEDSDREWLIVGAVAVVLTWIAASSSQAGTVGVRLPLRGLFATQVAGSFLNHVLPAGIGQAGLNLRLLRRAGLSVDGAAGAVALNIAAGFIVHAAALAAVLAFDPHVIHLAALGKITIVWIAGVVICCAALAVALRKRWPARLAARGRLSIAATSSVLRQPSRAALLWGGSAALPALHTVILVAVLHALHRPVPVLTVAALYLAASAVGAVLPGPGAIGGLDVALVSGLIGVGLGAPSATAAVIAYRMLTVWLPMLPGAVVLEFMLRKPTQSTEVDGPSFATGVRR